MGAAKKEPVKTLKLYPKDAFHYFDKNGNYKFSRSKIVKYLDKIGVRIYKNEWIFIENGIAIKVDNEWIYTRLLDKIRTYEDDYLEDEFIKQLGNPLLKSNAIILGVKKTSRKPHKDDKNSGYIYFENGIVCVSATNISITPYSKIDSFVWKEQVADKEIKLLDPSDDMGDFEKFVKNVTNNDEHFFSVASAFGYLLHRYKFERRGIVIVFQDENPEDDEEAGGSGKGLSVKALGYLRNLLYKGMKTITLDNRFAWTGVDESTDILFLDDVHRNFYNKHLYNASTDKLNVEEKHKKAIVLEYQDSPKIVITTNYTIKGDSSSDKRRVFDVVLNGHYSSEHTPFDDFGKEFFHDWDDIEWNKFFGFMFTCLQIYLEHGLVEHNTPLMDLKKLRNNTNADFVEMMDENFNHNGVVKIKTIKNQLLTYGDKFHFLDKDHKTIVKWIKKYAIYKGYNLKESRSDGLKTICFTDAPPKIGSDDNNVVF